MKKLNIKLNELSIKINKNDILLNKRGTRTLITPKNPEEIYKIIKSNYDDTNDDLYYKF